MRRRKYLVTLLVVLAASSLGLKPRPPKNHLPDVPHERVDYWVDQFSHTPEYRKKVAAALERKPNVESMVCRKLRKRGMPEDLLYLAMEESAFNPAAHSSEEAVGLWQLTKDTAHLYHLRADKKRDDRRNVDKETDAALDFLDHLYGRFGSWYLAAAAYNSGENRVARIMNETFGHESGRDRDYYRIWAKLPGETRDFVPAIMALRKIGKNPAKYGFAAAEKTAEKK